MMATPKECDPITPSRVRAIMFRCGESGKLTKDELGLVRRCFAFIYQTQGKGGVNENFPCMKNCFAAIDADALKPIFKPNVPLRMPTGDELKKAFTTPWTKECGVPFLMWCQLLLASYDTFFNGHRPRSDTGRVKKNSSSEIEAKTRHIVNAGEGWGSTAFHGGRSKLSGIAKGRPWRAFRVCHCPGGNHVSPKLDYDEEPWDAEGNMTAPIDWTTECPVACFQVVTKSQVYLHPKYVGLFKQWNPNKRRWRKDNIDNIAKMALRFLEVQGIQGQFDEHCGRKVYGRICDAMKPQIPYKDSFQVHGDLPSTWHMAYQYGMQPTKYSTRSGHKAVTPRCAAEADESSPSGSDEDHQSRRSSPRTRRCSTRCARRTDSVTWPKTSCSPKDRRRNDHEMICTLPGSCTRRSARKLPPATRKVETTELSSRFANENQQSRG